MRKTIAPFALVAAMASSGLAFAQSAELPELPSGVHCVQRGLAPHYEWDFARQTGGTAVLFRRLESVSLKCGPVPTTHRLTGLPGFTRSSLGSLVVAVRSVGLLLTEEEVKPDDAIALLSYYAKEIEAIHAKEKKDAEAHAAKEAKR